MQIIRLNLDAIPVVIGLLFVFGFAYNVLTGWLERKGYSEGYTALLVVGGVLVTIIGVALINGYVASLVFGCFAASGFWMVIGSIWRHVKARERAQKAIKDEAARMAE